MKGTATEGMKVGVKVGAGVDVGARAGIRGEEGEGREGGRRDEWG